MSALHTLWPDPHERALVGRFYLAVASREALNVVQPFQFAFLYLAMERAEWAVLAVMVESATFLLLEIPTGVIADRFGRKASTLIGDVISALAWALVPVAVSLAGTAQLLAVAGCFLLRGVGETLVSGAQEAWVVDNLGHAGRPELVPHYFARARSFTALGAVLAATAALALLCLAAVDRGLLDLLWYLAAGGLLLSVAIGITIAEHRPAPPAAEPAAAGGFFSRDARPAIHTLVHRRALFLLFWAIVIATFSGSIADEAFDMSLVVRGLDARGLAALAVATNLVGMLAPLAGLALMRHWGPTPVLTALLVAGALAVGVLFGHPGLALVIGLCILLDFFDGAWDPVAWAHLHSMIPSARRATIASLVNQASGVAEILGIGAFTVLLGEHSDALREATPDLVQAFSGGVSTLTQVPLGWFGLPLPDLAIVLFVGAGLLAVPFLLWSALAARRPD